MDGIGLVRDEIQKARKQITGNADRSGAVTRTEAIAIVRRAVTAGVSVDDIRTAFREAGDNGFGRPMERYLNEFDVIRLIGSEPEKPVQLPREPKLTLQPKAFSSRYGELELKPQVGPGNPDRVVLQATCSNPYTHSSGPGETPLVYGRDGLFDQVVLHVYGYEFSDPLTDDDQARAAALARDPAIARAREAFIESKPGRVEIALPRKPHVAHD